MTNKNAEQLTSISPACHFPLYVKLTKTTAITKKAIQVYTIALSNLPREGMELSAFFLDFPIKALKNCIRICSPFFCNLLYCMNIIAFQYFFTSEFTFFDKFIDALFHSLMKNKNIIYKHTLSDIILNHICFGDQQKYSGFHS